MNIIEALWEEGEGGTKKSSYLRDLKADLLIIFVPNLEGENLNCGLRAFLFCKTFKIPDTFPTLRVV